jgi:endonuclease/exonuclease/phosphatase family metal-dependent hydrolase
LKNFSKKIVLLINLGAVFALLMAYLSNYVNPEKTWILAFFGLAYPYILIFNIGFVFLWMTGRNKIALISLFAILLGVSDIGRFFQLKLSNKEKISESAFKVLTYNVRLFNYFEWEKTESVRDSILDFITDEASDIVCIQDFFTRNKPGQSEKYIKSKLSYAPYKHIEYTYNFSNGNSDFGIATFSKHPIINRGKIKFEKSVNACIYSDILINDDTIRVYNVHLQSNKLRKDNYGILDSIFHHTSNSFDDVKDISSRLRDAYVARSKQVKLLVEHMQKSPYPVILCGDFNDTPVSYTYQKLLGNKKDAYRESGGGIGNTYRGKLPSYRIDYVFHDRRFQSENYKTKKIKFSDHFPVTCYLNLRD